MLQLSTRKYDQFPVLAVVLQFPLLTNEGIPGFHVGQPCHADKIDIGDPGNKGTMPRLGFTTQHDRQRGCPAYEQTQYQVDLPCINSFQAPQNRHTGSRVRAIDSLEDGDDCDYSF